ncbi:helix-turn-helix domain-containing protein [Mucilaginibacter aquatilis]|uniref:Helix-turn-helix domain-containing protein n=1 Tax=Mucilaginibacter aquatilis TaxID=1517760 RepID=A0A6I4IPS0_9SPHI|nr:helix-turn-helix transcriptional regulator [Mucilaginibacter aquatilis]MVN90503.1 helix-turn-helix domain-containing protein [Mucilaginibacter aquatilis]
MAETIHIGRKISRIRELRGMKQDALAAQLGISQQAISKIEQSENVEDESLIKIATALGLSPEAIRNFSEEAVFTNISNTFNDTSYLINYQFNPIDKIVELYERLLKSEQEKIELLKGKQ